jgi:hypothetical protein
LKREPLSSLARLTEANICELKTPKRQMDGPARLDPFQATITPIT